MRGRNSSDRSSINPNFALQFQLFNAACHHSFRIELSLRWRQVVENPNRRFPVAPIVPTNNIDVSFKEEVKPVCIWCYNHLLIDQSVWTAHQHSWFVDILRNSLLLRILTFVHRVWFFWFNYNLFLLSAWKEHAVDCVAVRSHNVELLSLECYFKDYLSLIVSSE